MTQSTTQPILPDFVFGGIESDESRLLANERARWQGIRHEQRMEPADPEPGQPVTLTVTVGPDVRVDGMAAYVTVGATADGGPPTGSRGAATIGFVVPLERVETRWENLIWDYVEVWQGEIPGQAEGTLVHYTIEGWGEDFNAEMQRGKGAEERGREGEKGRNGEGSATSSPEAQRRREHPISNLQSPISHWSREIAMDGTLADATLYGYCVDRWRTPAWAREAVVGIGYRRSGRSLRAGREYPPASRPARPRPGWQPASPAVGLPVAALRPRRCWRLSQKSGVNQPAPSPPVPGG